MTDVVRTVRAMDVANGCFPPHFEAPLASLETEGNPWGEKRQDRVRWIEGSGIPEFVPQHDLCLFTCCTAAYDDSNRSSVLALPALLERAGASFGILGNEESCCGDLARQVGREDLFELLARSNTDLLQRRGVEHLVVSSPHCLLAFAQSYPELQGRTRIEHYTVLLDRYVQSGRLCPTRVVEQKVTFHDPCYLGRHCGIYEEPRRVLRSIPGLELVEMQRNRAESLCCGGGGGGAFHERSRDQQFAVLRVREALDTGADVIATACPYCIRMLMQAIHELGIQHRIGVQDVAELLMQSVEKQDDALDRAPLALVQESCHA
jgi:Fe-S oxidoreductase